MIEVALFCGALAASNASDTAELRRDLAVALARAPATAAPAAAPAKPVGAATGAEAPLALRAPEQSSLAPRAIGGVTLGLALLAAVWLRARKKRERADLMHVRQSLALGKGRALVIIDVDGRRLLIGVGDAGIALLDAQRMPAPPTSLQAEADTWCDASLSLAGEGAELKRKIEGRAA